jgi:uncharacterized protein (TIGR00251 family)
VTRRPDDPAGLEFRPDGTGTRLRLRVAAGASRSRVAGAHGGALKLSVRTAPERGRANREVLELLASRFGVAARDIDLVSGATSPDKVVRLPLGPEEAERRWTAPGPLDY